MTAVEQLQQLGFSPYEAQAYVALLKENPLNGYELARVSGIPRPNIYSILQKLEERGAVLRVDDSESARYAPVPPKELIDRLSRQYQGALETASNALSEVTVSTTPDAIFNARGYATLIDHARAMIAEAHQHLLLGVWPEEAQALSDSIREAKGRGVELTTLCLRGCPQQCPNCQGSVFRYPLAGCGKSRWLVLVPDNAEVLAGEISRQQEALAVRTRQKMLVNVSAGYLQNSIVLASILESLGNRLDEALDPSTRAALDTLYSLQTQGKWFEELRQMINTKETLYK